MGSQGVGCLTLLSRPQGLNTGVSGRIPSPGSGFELAVQLDLRPIPECLWELRRKQQSLKHSLPPSVLLAPTGFAPGLVEVRRW